MQLRILSIIPPGSFLGYRWSELYWTCRYSCAAALPGNSLSARRSAARLNAPPGAGRNPRRTPDSSTRSVTGRDSERIEESRTTPDSTPRGQKRDVCAVGRVSDPATQNGGLCPVSDAAAPDGPETRPTAANTQRLNSVRVRYKVAIPANRVYRLPLAFSTWDSPASDLWSPLESWTSASSGAWRPGVGEWNAT